MDYKNPEKQNASRILAKNGIYVDTAGVTWEKESLERLNVEQRHYLFGFDPLYVR